ncbi:hypothetical protein ACHAWF_000042, partial [Thalassiosira exigua]
WLFAIPPTTFHLRTPTGLILTLPLNSQLSTVNDLTAQAGSGAVTINPPCRPARGQNQACPNPFIRPGIRIGTFRTALPLEKLGINSR